jgi:hypothetical protein
MAALLYSISLCRPQRTHACEQSCRIRHPPTALDRRDIFGETRPNGIALRPIGVPTGQSPTLAYRQPTIQRALHRIALVINTIVA